MRDRNRPHWADRPLGRAALWAVAPLFILFAWWLGIRSGSAVVPGFGEVWHVLSHPFDRPDVNSRSLAFSTYITIIRLALGFALGALTAIPLGLWAGGSRVVDRLMEPWVQTARPVNPIVLLPIATVFFGLASLATMAVGGVDAWRYDVLDQIQLAMLFILWWGAFFPIFLGTVHGVRTVRTAHRESFMLLGATPSQVMVKLVLPHSLPSILSGMRIAMGVTWMVLIAAEVFPGTRSGLGYMLCTACKTSDYQYTFAALIVIAVIAWLTDMALMRAEQATGRWQAAER